MKLCLSCLWVDCIVLWNRWFPVRSELRKMSLTLAALAQATIHTHNRVNQLKGIAMSNQEQVAALNDVVDQLVAKVNESNVTLAGLASAVLALRADLGKSDIEAAVAAIKVKAQAALDSLSAAEDAADDALPAAPAPAAEPPQDDMCPNCVTPWKCNGPHEPAAEPPPAPAPDSPPADAPVEPQQ